MKIVYHLPVTIFFLLLHDYLFSLNLCNLKLRHGKHRKHGPDYTGIMV